MFTTITKQRKITIAIAIAVAVAVLVVAALVGGYLVYKSKSKNNTDDSKPWTSLKTIKPTQSDCSTATYKWTGDCAPGKAASWTGTFTVVNNLSVPVDITDGTEGGGGQVLVLSAIPTQTTSGLTFNNYVPCVHDELSVNTAGTPNATTVQKLPTCFSTMIIDDQSNITYK